METKFRQWMIEAGFNGKQVTQAGQAIGMSRNTAQLSHIGKRELTLTERLAMSAHLNGLEPY